MAAPTQKIFTVGLNSARIYALNSSGTPAATNATVYDGILVGGPTGFSLTTPKPTKIAHPGNNSILQYDILPGLDVSEGTLTVSRQDNATIALLSNTKVHSIGNTTGEMSVLGWMTSQQSTEPTVLLTVYDQAKDNAGNRVWHTYVMPRTIIYPSAKGMSRERSDMTYDVQPSIVTAYPNGIAFNASDNGFTSAQILDFQSAHRLHIAAWVTTATETEYVFNTALPAYITGGVGMVVTKNGVLMTYGATADATHYVATTTKITFGAALTNADKVVCMYQLDDTAIDQD